jgi:20S proteasome alpha/beta subunit
VTTVAYKDGILACDSCWTSNSMVDTLSKKITRLKYGVLLGHSGDNDGRAFVKLLNAVKKFEDLPTFAELDAIKIDFLGLLIFPDKRIAKISTSGFRDRDDDIGVWEIEGSFTAVGTGAEFAIGAMEAGATARQAVLIACKRDINSRPPVWTLSLPKKGK